MLTGTNTGSALTPAEPLLLIHVSGDPSHMAEFAKERFRDIFEEVLPLVRKHYEEIAWRKDDIPLDINKERYFEVERQGLYHVWTVRKEGVLIGYSAWVTIPSLHYWSTPWGMSDVVFVLPGFRGIGTELARHCERELKALGVKAVHYHVKASYDWSPALERLGYEKIETHWAKWIG